MPPKRDSKRPPCRANAVGLKQHILGATKDDKKKKFPNRSFSAQREKDVLTEEFFQESQALQRMKEIKSRVQQDLMSVRQQCPCADEYEILDRLLEANAHPMAISIQRNRIDKLEEGCPQDQGEVPSSYSSSREPSNLQTCQQGNQPDFSDEDLPPELTYNRPYQSRRRPRPDEFYSMQSATARIKGIQAKVAEDMRQARANNPGASDFEILKYLIDTGAHPQTIANLQEKIKRERGAEKPVPRKAPERLPGTSENASNRGITPKTRPPPVIGAPVPRTNPGRLKEMTLRGLDSEEEESFLDMTETPNMSTSVRPPRRRLLEDECEAPTSGGGRRERKRYSWQPDEKEEAFQPTEWSGRLGPSYRPTGEVQRNNRLPDIPEEPSWLDEHKARLGAVREMMRARGMGRRSPVPQEKSCEPCSVQAEESNPCENIPAKDKDRNCGRPNYYYLSPMNITQHSPESSILSRYESSMGTPSRNLSPCRVSKEEGDGLCGSPMSSSPSSPACDRSMAMNVECDRTAGSQQMEMTCNTSRSPRSRSPSSPKSCRSTAMDLTCGARSPQMVSGDCYRTSENQQMEMSRASSMAPRSKSPSYSVPRRSTTMDYSQGNRCSQTASDECNRTAQDQSIKMTGVSSGTPRRVKSPSQPRRLMMTNITQGSECPQTRTRECSYGPRGDSVMSSFDIGQPDAESTAIEFNRKLGKNSTTKDEKCSCSPTTDTRSSFSGLPAWMAGENTGRSSRSCWSQQTLKRSPSKVKNLINEEKKEIRAMHEVMSLVREPSTQVQFKDMNTLVPHVFTADENETAPEVAAKMLYSDEKGLSLKATPAKVYNMLFHGEGDAKTVIRVNAPSISSKAPVLVPLSSEGVEASLSGYAQNNYSSLPNEDETAMPSINKEAGEVGNMKDNLGYSASSIGKESSSSLGDDRFKIILEPDLPKERDLIQVRGSQPPPWFPGYYAMMGNDVDINVVDKPWGVLERAWRQMIPEKIQTETGKIIVGS